jgi:hypothetical protein
MAPPKKAVPPPMSFADMIKNASGNLKKTGTIVVPEKKKDPLQGNNAVPNPLQRKVSHMDTLKEQIMMRKQALNPDMKKKPGQEGEDLAKKSYYMSKFAEILSDEEDDEESNNSDID